MKKFYSVLTGIFCGITMAAIIFTVALSSVLTSTSFFLKQDERYGLTESMELKNGDEFNRLSIAVRNAFNGKKDTDAVVEFSDGTKKEAFSEEEKDMLLNASKNINTARIISLVAAVAAIALVILRISKGGREQFLYIGISSAITALLIAGALNILLSEVEPLWGWENFFYGFGDAPVLRKLISSDFAADFSKGYLRFFDFLMIIPIAVSYFMMCFSAKRNFDPNEDYMYQ